MILNYFTVDRLQEERTTSERLTKSSSKGVQHNKNAMFKKAYRYLLQMPLVICNFSFSLSSASLVSKLI
jgi:hypothetical protein